MADSAPIYVYPANLLIPIDLFVSKEHGGLTRGHLRFFDSSGNIVFQVTKPSHKKKVVLDSAGNPLISIYRHHNGVWEGFKGDGGSRKELIFKVHRTLNKFSRTELDVYLVGEDQAQATLDFRVKGCPFQKSCTIYQGNSIAAQSGLMYKLRQIYVRRNRFRLTIFPGSIDPDRIVALIVIFLDGRK